MEKGALQAAIRAAFEDVPYPGDDNIGDPNGRDDAESVSRGFCGTDWRMLKSERELWSLGLIFMTDEAAHYYLPAYLLVGMENPVRDAMTGALLILDPYFGAGSYHYPEMCKRFSQFVSRLSPSQKKVIRDVLIYALDERIEDLMKCKEAGPEPDIDNGQTLDEITEEEKEEDRIWWDEQIEETWAEYAPMIEYWSHA
jgi:hypothetical protein